MVDYVKIGQRIRKFRKANKLSQEELAERIWISTTHMSHIETGSTKLSLPVLVDIAEALHVKTDDLLFEMEDGDMPIEEIKNILAACTPAQARILAEVIKSAKTAMDKYQ